MLNKKITEPWTSIGTILGQPVIDSYTFYLKKYKAKKGDIVAAEAKLPTGEGKVIDVIVWGRITEIISSNDFLPNEATHGKFSPVTSDIICFSTNNSHVFLSVIFRCFFFVSFKKMLLFCKV